MAVVDSNIVMRIYGGLIAKFATAYDDVALQHTLKVVGDTGGGGGGETSNAAIGTTADIRIQAADQTNVTLIGLMREVVQQAQDLNALLTAALGDDEVPVAQSTELMYSAGVELIPKYAVVSAAASGNNTLVAGVSGKKIRVVAYNLISAGVVNAKFQSGASGTDLTGLKYMPAAGNGICAPFSPIGWFETAAAALLNLNLSAAVAVGGEITYVEV